MSKQNIFNWVVNTCNGFRLSQRKTLAEIVCGVLKCRRVSLADLGRSMQTNTTAKHNIKRVYRFLQNNRIDVSEGCRSLLHLVANASGKRLLVAVDWVDVREYKALRAAVPLKGRSVPVLFAVYEKWQIHKSQNAFEEGFFRLLKALAPAECEMTIIADRGFKRAELARTLQSLGLHYVIRLTPDVWFSSAGHYGRLDEVKMKWGKKLDLGFGEFRKVKPVRQRVVVYWERGKAEPWFLGTDLSWGGKKIVGVFRQRMQIEELFRDEKNIRYGWGLRQTGISRADRLERLFLVLAFAYLLLLLLGMKCQRQLSPAHWSASSKGKQQSAFVVGRIMLGRTRVSLPTLLKLLTYTLSHIIEENWG